MSSARFRSQRLDRMGRVSGAEKTEEKNALLQKRGTIVDADLSLVGVLK